MSLKNRPNLHRCDLLSSQLEIKFHFFKSKIFDAKLFPSSFLKFYEVNKEWISLKTHRYLKSPPTLTGLLAVNF